ncbi:MAG: type I-U CRISPR-associated protein Csb2 [Peptococcaceae bacterium]|jgi:CRISPR-associated protein Csb2|nr:type I-U CRISPR-associated protein Csb2 [Peptococcaceae bacterium]
MFGIGIHYLNGWACAAADGAKKERAEWPPHPDRVFMALAAAWFGSDRDPAGRAALEWLEGLQPPGIVASGAEYRHVDGSERPAISYVPVNDTRRDLGVLPDRRSRQPRSFPVAIPHDPKVYLVWQEELPGTHRIPLAHLCRTVVSVGHSASLVQMWLDTLPPRPNLVPVEGIARHRLRIFGRGRLRYLEICCNRDCAVSFADLEAGIKAAKGKDKKTLKTRLDADFPDGRPVSLRPRPGIWQGYGIPLPESLVPTPGSVFDPNPVVLALSGSRLTVRETLRLTEAVRGAILANCPEPVPEWVSGHTPAGLPSTSPHLAFLPLPFVGREHADGRLMGVALALPRQVPPEETVRCLSWLRDEHGLPLPIRLFEGNWFECTAELDSRDEPPVNLRPGVWTGPARHWATVTPIVFDRHFRGTERWDKAAEMVKDACCYAGLPRPVEVLLHPVSLFEGVPVSREFPRLIRQTDRGGMNHAHAVILFGQDVEGPVLVGAGRYRGYGLCRPVRQGG